MFYLDRLVDNKLYNKFPISGISVTNQDKRNGTCLMVLGKDQNETISVLNAGLVSPMNFKSFYIPRKIKTVHANKVTLIKQKDYYDVIKSKAANISFTLTTIEAYKGKNLIYDMSQEIEFTNSIVKVSGKRKYEIMSKMIMTRLYEIKNHYQNVIIVCPVSVNEASYTNINAADSMSQYIYHMLQTGILDDEMVIMFAPASRIYTKFTGKEDSNNESMKIIRRLQNRVNGVDEDAEENVEVKTVNDDEVVKDVPEAQVNKELKPILNKIGLKIDKVPSDIHPMVSALQDMVQEVIKTKSEEEMVEEVLNKSPEFLEMFNELVEIKKVGMSNAEAIKKTERIRKLKEKQGLVQVTDNLTIADILADFEEIKLEPTILPARTINKEIQQSSVKNFDNSYQKKVLEKDIASVFTAFNDDTDIKIFTTRVQKTDSSDDLSNKETYSLTMEDDRGNKHSVTFDLPKVKEGKFMYVNGGKKLIQKQIMLLPIIKTHPDKVQVTSNANKFFVERFGQKMSSRLDALKRLCISDALRSSNIEVKKGNAKGVNSKLQTNLEYLDFSDSVSEINFGDLKLQFNYNLIMNMLNPNKPDFNEKVYNEFGDKDKDFMLFGYSRKELIMFDRISGEVYSQINGKNDKVADSLFDYVLGLINKSNVDKKVVASFLNKKPGKSYAYSRIAINSKRMPLICILGYELGLSKVLERYEIKYKFSQEVPKYAATNKQEIIRFLDGYLTYDSSLLRNSLLLNGLSAVGCEEYSFEDMDTIEPYLDMFYQLTGSRNAGKGIHNNLSLMIDPLTLDVLRKLHLPENIYDILLYSNTLLEDVTFKKMNDMSTYRIRGAEQIPALAYNCLANYVREYKDKIRAGNNNARISMPRDIVIKKILELATVDEYSTLNPSLEIERSSGATYKGLSGINLDKSLKCQILFFNA